MGGALLKSWGLPEKRIDSTEYFSLIDKVKQIVADIVFSILKDAGQITLKLGVAPTFRKKESHGDLDMLIWVNHHIPHQKLRNAIFDVSGYYPNVNDSTYSFPIDGFQVDLKFCKRLYFNSSLNYSSWGDCGNLVGRIAHKLGLSYGHDGLGYFVREREFDGRIENDHIVEKILLTTETSEIFDILGLNYDVWWDGFDTEQDMWTWLIGSKYFNADIYDWDNLNHQNRTRNRKRPGYCRFLEYINDNKERLPRFEFESKEIYFERWKQIFVHLGPRIEKLRKHWETAQAIKQKFNGKLVMDWLGLTEGQDLGKIIAKFKHSKPKEYFEIESAEQIKADFLRDFGLTN